MSHVARLSARVILGHALGGIALTLGASTTAGAQAVKANPVAASAPAHISGPAWDSLSAQQRAALSPLARDWAQIDSQRKSKWLEVASRFPRMPADEQQRVQARMAEWARLSPAERTNARLNFQETKQLSREEKQARWEAYQALPAEERQALAARGRPAPLDNKAKTAASGVAPIYVAQPKQNVMPAAGAASSPPVKPISPTVVQAKPGATTTLITQSPTRPAHQQPGEPKIAARPGQVDRSTLLPKTGPQAAASVPGTGRQP